MRYPARIPILYLILGVLVLAAVVPMYFYAHRVVDINRERLKADEMLLQTTVTRSLRDDIGQRQSNLRNMFSNFTTAVAVVSGGDLGGSKLESPQLRSLLEKFVATSGDLAYATLLNEQSKGISAGRVQLDVFMQKEMERAFAAAREGRSYTGQPLALGGSSHQRTVMLVSEPIVVGGRFVGMAGAFEDLQFLVDRLQAARLNGLYTYVVDGSGRLVAGASNDYATGQDMKHFDIVKSFVDQGGKVPLSSTTEFISTVQNQNISMLGTYALVPALNWAVISQKTKWEAYAGVNAIQREAIWLAVVAVAVSMLISVLAARSITHPLSMLTETSNAISRGDFTKRVELKSRTEIGQLASTFNLMAENLEKFVADLKRAAEENRTLFLSSIQMLAGAVDEKDPYTRGHSDRVTRYSVLIATEMGLPPEDVANVRVAAQLHDVGKIGIEDRVLKKPGALTPDEYELMKAHTTKGANILRPVQQLTEIIPGIELHHESLDGRGYPYGLKGDEIPISARIIMVADAFDAMTTDRPYQQAKEPEYVIRIINSLVNTKFDPAVVTALTRLFEQGELAPVGIQSSPVAAVAEA
jgi:putative nucleotidyltransferase with HDIG domain